MDDLDWMVVFGAGLPFVIGLVFLLPFSKREESGRDKHAWRIVLGVSLASIIAFSRLYDWPTSDLTRSAWWTNLGQDQLLLYAVLAGLGLGLVMSFTPRALWMRAGLIVALAGLVTLIAWPIVKTEAVMYRAMPAAGTILFASVFELAAVRRPGFCVPFALSVSLASTSVLVIATGFQPLGFSALAAAVVLGVGSLIALRRPKLMVADGAVVVLVPLLVLAPLFAWVNLMFYGDDFPALGFLLPMLAPCLVLVGELPKLKDRKPFVRNGIVLGLVVFVCAVGFALAFWPAGSADGEPMYDEMGFPIDP